MRSCGFLATPLPSPCRHSVPFAFPFLASCAGVISVTVSSGPALVTFSLALLGQKMQRQPFPQNDVCSREPQTCPCLPRAGALQARDDKTCPHVVQTGRIWRILNPSVLSEPTGTQDRDPKPPELVPPGRDTHRKFTFAHSQKNLSSCFKVVSSPMEETVWRAKPILGTNFN